MSTSTPAAHEAPDGADAVRAATARLDELQRLRDADPGALLQQWPAIEAGLSAVPDGAERSLLHARALLLRGGAHLWRNELQPARDCGQAAQSALQAPLQRPEAVPGGSARRLEVQAAHLLAFVSQRAGDMEAAAREYLHAAALAEAAGELEYVARTQVNLANVYEEAGLAAEALEHHRAALSVAHRLGLDELRADIEHNVGNVLAALGDGEAALQAHQRAHDAFVAMNLPRKRSASLVGLAESSLKVGRLDEAAARLDELDRMDPLQRFPFSDAYAAELRARLAEARHDLPAAQAAWRRAIEANQAIGYPPGTARSLTGLARQDLGAGRLEAADGHARELLALLDGAPGNQRELEEAQALASAVAEALGDTSRALALARAHQHTYARLFNDGAALKARLLAVRHQVERARAEADRHRLENARLNDALMEVAARLQQFESRPATPGEAPGPQALRALGLTPREAEVLYWVSMGKTNEDVATILDTGMAAVKKHLGRIYEKLGVENRTAAAAAARRHAA